MPLSHLIIHLFHFELILLVYEMLPGGPILITEYIQYKCLPTKASIMLFYKGSLTEVHPSSFIYFSGLNARQL